MNKKEIGIIGWREFVSLPEFTSNQIKAKVDSGARTSSLHAHKLEVFKKGASDYARFFVYPHQDISKDKILCEAKVREYRDIKSSNGMSEKRPVILTPIKLGDQIWTIELTLTNRDEMGFRMLLGRTSISKKFLIDVSKSFLMS